MPKPKFISGYDRPTAAERGTATHLFLSLYAPEKPCFPQFLEISQQIRPKRILKNKFTFSKLSWPRIWQIS